jgi:hypothetical protein
VPTGGRLAALVASHQAFLSTVRVQSVATVLEPLSSLCHGNRALAHAVWTDLYPSIWAQASAEVAPKLCKQRREGPVWG